MQNENSRFSSSQNLSESAVLRKSLGLKNAITCLYQQDEKEYVLEIQQYKLECKAPKSRGRREG